MYVLFVIGNIASGKSTLCRHLAACGARHIDLDRMAKELYQPSSPLVQELCETFGWDILDADGSVVPSRLAARAFADADTLKALNAIVHPALREQLSRILVPPQCCSMSMPAAPLTVVEVSAPAGFTDTFALADDVLAVTAPFELRRARAISRGMDAAAFDHRAELQPTEDELAALATKVVENTGDEYELFQTVDAWLRARGIVLADGDAANTSVQVGVSGASCSSAADGCGADAKDAAACVGGGERDA